MRKSFWSRLFARKHERQQQQKQEAIRARVPNRRLSLEKLEDRTLPAATVTNLLPAAVVSNSTSVGFGYAPQVVIDPINHLKMVEVNATGGALAGRFSIDGGQTWAAMAIPGNIADPNISPFTVPNTFAVAQTPSVAFDRSEAIYIVSAEQNAAGTSGAIVIEKFDFSPSNSFSGTKPTSVDLTPSFVNGQYQTDLGTGVLYRWFNQDAAYNPVVAVDTNVPTFTDPKTGFIQKDTLANSGINTATGVGLVDSKTGLPVPKAVYVAWNTNFTQPSGSLFPTVSRVVAEASADGGHNFTTMQRVSDPGIPSIAAPNVSAPQIVFTQQGPGTTGGKLLYVWTNGSGIQMDLSSPDGGNAATQVAATQPFTFSGGSIGDASASGTTVTYNLSSAMSQTDTTLTVVTNGTSGPPPVGQTITIDQEQLLVQGTSGTTWTVARAQGGTAAASHVTGSTVTWKSSGADVPNTTIFTGSVNINAPNLTNFTVNDLDVTLNLLHPHVNQLQIVLTGPGALGSITLVRNAVNGAGNGTGVGLGDSANMGDILSSQNPFYRTKAGTVFDDQADRAINDPTATGPYVGHFRPEVGSFASLVQGQLLSALNGTWTLTIKDFRSDGTNPAPNQELTNWSLHFTGLVNPASSGNGEGTFGSDTAVKGAATLAGSVTNVYGQAGLFAYGTPGVGPGVVVAVDNTLGSFSPYQGRIYLAYAGGGGSNTNVFLISSDDNGTTWSKPKQVNDDSRSDNFSEGNRPQFMPSITVDPTTGTLVYSYYDGRNDPSLTRVANSITVSVDGGAHFSPISYLNQLKQATDFLTGKTVTLEPIPGNQGVAGTYGFGDRQGLVAYAGTIIPFFASNLNAAGSTINTAFVTTAAGPRVLAGDMGPVIADFTQYNANTRTTITYNNIPANDGTRKLDSFVIQFDRPVDVASFTASNVTVQYQDPNTGAITPVLLDTTTPVLALDSFVGFGPNGVGSDGTLATQFQIKLKTPQSKVGTYSYAIGPTVQDDVRTASFLNAPMGAGDTAMTVTSNIGLSIASPFVIKIDNEQILVTNASTENWTIVRGYNGTTAAAHTQFIGPSTNQTVVSLLGNKMDQNANALPGEGATRPATTFVNQVTMTKTDETLTVTSSAGFPATPFVVQIDSEQIEVTGIVGSTWTIRRGFNGTTKAVHVYGSSISTINEPDQFAIPTPTSGVPFQAGYNPETLPLIIPGPHVISTSVPNNPVTSDNLVLNTTNGALDVLFDRNIAANTFVPQDILSIIGPIGAIPLVDTNNKPLVTVTQDAVNKKLFHLKFPTQTLSGTYNIVIAPGFNGTYITDTSPQHNRVDTNLNAGLDVLRGVSNPTNAAITRPVYAVSPTGTAAAIPASGTLASTITIPDAFPIVQSLAQNQFVELELNINHGNIPDLSATLTSPDGKTVVHLFPVGTGTFGPTPHANFFNTVFDDSSTNPITLAGSPVTVGPYDPQTPLSALSGLSSAGTWTLTITNTGSTTGTLTHWELRLPKVTPTSGLGETVADQIQTSFRIFTQAIDKVQSSVQWTPVGPAANNFGANSGRIGGLAVDPSDPSGNTVFVAGASGGVWKTTNFLTTNANGPTYVPLTDLGPGYSLNIGSIAVFGRNNDPNQTVVFAATGEGDVGSPGVGFLRSMDGGKTWQVLDSTTNVDAKGVILPMASAGRDHIFVGTTSFKVVVDPTPQTNGQIAVYAALSGTNGGLWRSLDSGNTWFKVQAGNADDVVLAPASRDVNGNIGTLYAAFRGQGVYTTNNALTASGLTLLVGGGTSTPRVADDLKNGPEIPTSAPSSTPNGAKGRIVLATPAVTNNPLDDTFYQGWCYAAVVTTTGALDGLYLTKDFGLNWTKLNLPVIYFVVGGVKFGTGYPSNNESGPSYSVTSGNLPAGNLPAQGNYDITLAIDPNNPNITYLGGTADGTPNPAGGFIRVDATKVADPYNFNAYSHNEVAGGTQFTTTGPTSVGTVPLQAGPGAPYGILNPADGTYNPAYLNLFREPHDPFNNPSTLHFTNVSNFNNDGTDVSWMPFGSGALGGTDQHELLAIRDPLTGRTRLIFGDDQGVWTGLDHGDGTLVQQVGTAQIVSGSRNGNLQITQFYYGASQPSTLAANLAGALFYGMAQDNGFPASAKDILRTGNLNWIGSTGDGTGVATDQTGSGTKYEYRWPCCSGFAPTDFFLVTPAGQAPIGRTSGLVQTGDSPATGVGQWPLLGGSNFAVNDFDPTGIVMSSQAGRIFRSLGAGTGGTGRIWHVIGEPGNLDGTYAPAMAFGAPTSSSTGTPDDYVYAGTTGGHIYVSVKNGSFIGNGVTNWKDISAGLDGSGVAQIVTNPKFGSNEAYAVTAGGVFWMADSSVAAPVWVPLTGTGANNLFNGANVARPIFNNATDKFNTLKYLTTIQADWRFAIPDATGTGTHPVLYVAGEGGIFRSRDKGLTWTNYPNIATDKATQEGGYLPNVHVTALSLVLGNFNPTTGFHDESAGFDMLLATTYGRGDFAIRMDNSAISQYNVTPHAGPKVISLTPTFASGGQQFTGYTVTFGSGVDTSTFTDADVTVTGPGNVPVTLAPDPGGVVAQGGGPTATTFAINFQSVQFAAGYYTITIGPNISDGSGNKMDQDSDGDGGLPDDAYTTTTYFTPNTPPTISQIANQVIKAGSSVTIPFTVGDAETPASQLVVTINDSDPQAVITQGGSGANRTMTITIPVGDTTPSSTVTYWVTDGGGLDSSHLTFGVNVLIAGPRVLSVLPENPVALGSTGSISAVDVTFDKGILASSFTMAAITSFTDPSGVTTITPTAINDISADHKTFQITFASQSVLGVYTLTLNPTITDLSGHRLNQDGDGSAGSLTDPADSYTGRFFPTTTATGPFVPVQIDALSNGMVTADYSQAGSKPNDGSYFSYNPPNRTWLTLPTTVTWVDTLTGDFLGNGKVGYISRIQQNGQWWLSNYQGPSSYNDTVRWGNWDTSITWTDVMVGNFAGSPRSDILGRDAATGDVWVSVSNGLGFDTTKWGNVPTTYTYLHAIKENGQTDLAAYDPATGTWYVYVSTGSSFTQQTWGTWPKNFQGSVTVGNFDGNPSGNQGILGIDTANKVHVLLANNPGGTATAFMPDAKWGDMPGGNYISLNTGTFAAHTNSGGQLTTDFSFYNTTNYTYQVGVTNAANNGFNITTWYTGNSLVLSGLVMDGAGDFNGDGKTDLAIRYIPNATEYILQSNGSSFSFSPFTPVTWASGVTWQDVRIADFNGDGKADIYAREGTYGSILFSQSVNEYFVASTTGFLYPDTPLYSSFLVGNFDGYGKSDLAFRILQSNQWYVAQTNGSQGIVNAAWTNWDVHLGWLNPVVGDFNGDGKDDIAGRDASTGNWDFSYSNGSRFTTFAAGTSSQLATWQNYAYVDVAVVDLNGDGKADLIGLNLPSGNVIASIANASGTGFTTALYYQYGQGYNIRNIAYGDFNGDGKTDVVAQYQNTIYVGMSDGSTFHFARSAWATVDPNWVDLRVGNFTGATNVVGINDLVFRDSSTGALVLLSPNATQPTFDINLTYGTWNNAFSNNWVDVLVGDMNGDGLDDIVGRLFTTGDWQVSLNKGTSFNPYPDIWDKWGANIAFLAALMGKA